MEVLSEDKTRPLMACGWGRGLHLWICLAHNMTGSHQVSAAVFRGDSFILTRIWNQLPAGNGLQLVIFYTIDSTLLLSIYELKTGSSDWTACSEDLSLPPGTDCWDTRDLAGNRLTCSACAAQLDRTATLFGRWILDGHKVTSLEQVERMGQNWKVNFSATRFHLHTTNHIFTTTINEQFENKKILITILSLKLIKILYTMSICKSILVFYRVVEKDLTRINIPNPYLTFKVWICKSHTLGISCGPGVKNMQGRSEVDSWSGKISHAKGQWSLCATTTEVQALEPVTPQQEQPLVCLN